MVEEMGARRRRLRLSLGDRGHSLFEFLLLSGLMIGSLGLVLRPWMVEAAPWGLAIPVLFLAGHLLLETRRQGAMRAAASEEAAEKLRRGYDWASVLWGLFCALAGVAAFIIAFSAEPAPPEQQDGWAPPESSVSVDILP